MERRPEGKREAPLFNGYWPMPKGKMGGRERMSPAGGKAGTLPLTTISLLRPVFYVEEKTFESCLLESRCSFEGPGSRPPFEEFFEIERRFRLAMPYRSP